MTFISPYYKLRAAITLTYKINERSLFTKFANSSVYVTMN